MKFGDAKLNLEITPSRASIKQVDKMLHRMERAMIKPLVALKKLLNHKMTRNAGSKLAGSIFEMAQKEIMKPIETLQIVVENQKKLMQQSLSLGITGGKQLGLNEYLGNLGLGGQIGDAIQSSFASALGSGQLTDLIKAGQIKGADAADKLRSFMLHISRMGGREQSDFLIKRGFSIQEANAIFRSRDYTDKDKYANLLKAKITPQDAQQDKNNFITNTLMNNTEIKKDKISWKKNLNTEEIQEYKKQEVNKFQEEVNNITKESFKAIKEVLDKQLQISQAIAEGIKKSVQAEEAAENYLKELGATLQKGSQKLSKRMDELGPGV